jgi:hypothetical protein
VTASHDTERLIEGLVETAQPVRRLSPPLRRAATWLAAAFLIVAGVVIGHGVRPDLAEQFARPTLLAEWAGAFFTGVLASIATFQLSLPDRSIRWLLLPVPAMLLWLVALGLGCVLDWYRMGPSAFEMTVSWSCVMAIVTTSVPLGLVLLVMVRHAGYVRPGPTALAGGLAVAALSAAGLSLFHHLDTALMILIWHIGTVALVAVLARVAGEWLFSWVAPRPV